MSKPFCCNLLQYIIATELCLLSVNRALLRMSMLSQFDTCVIFPKKTQKKLIFFSCIVRMIAKKLQNSRWLLKEYSTQGNHCPTLLIPWFKNKENYVICSHAPSFGRIGLLLKIQTFMMSYYWSTWLIVMKIDLFWQKLIILTTNKQIFYSSCAALTRTC